MWGLTAAVTIVLAHYSSEVYRAKRKPKLSVLAQWLHIIVLCPAILFSVKYGYETLCYVRSIARLEFVLAHMIVMRFALNYAIQDMFTNIFPSLAAALAMMIILLLPFPESLLMNLLYAVLASVLYLSVLMMFPKERNICLNLKSIIKKSA